MWKALTSSISKKLTAFVIAAGVAALNKKLGLDISPEAIYGLFALAISFIVGQSHVDAKKAISNAVNSITGAVASATVTNDGTPIETLIKPPMSYQELAPYINDVHTQINQMHEQLKTGKYTESTQHIINMYMTLHDYLIKSEQAKGA